jgi:hypothetical protein
MADEKKGGKSADDLKEDQIISRLAAPGQTPTGLISFTGLLARSSKEGYWLLYPSLDMSRCIELRAEDVVHSEPLSPERSPFGSLGGTRVFVKRDATVTSTQHISQSHDAQQAADEFDLDIRLGQDLAALPKAPCIGTSPGTTCAAECGGGTGAGETCLTCVSCGDTCFRTCDTCRTLCEQATCDTCRTCHTACGQATCRTCQTACGQATCNTCQTRCNQPTCQATCNTCQTRCGQATCNTCQTRCNQQTCQRTVCATCPGDTCQACTHVTCFQTCEAC